MRFCEQLCWRLTEIAHLILNRLAQSGVVDRRQIDGALVGEIVEDVGGAHSLRTSLLVPEYEIDPLMQLTGD